MNTRSSTCARIRCALSVALVGIALGVWAQTPPSLSIQFSDGLPRLNLMGETGMVYEVQVVGDPAPSNLWTAVTLLPAMAANELWADPAGLSSSERFYRAVSVLAPGDTNLVFIPPGNFIMGSPTNEADRSSIEGPQTKVTISRGFWMGKYLVTQGEYLAVMGTNSSYFNGDRSGAPWFDQDYGTDLQLPVEQVSWHDATNYCARLTSQEQGAGRIPATCVFRLPTEAEWEYACRAGTTTRFFYGDDPDYTNLVNYAWFADNSGNVTHPVGLLLANPWGLYDMAGNVWQWCLDWNGAYPGGSVTDPRGPPIGTNRVWRGGSWFYSGRFCRSARRLSHLPTYQYAGLGFRVVLALDPP